MIHGSTFTPNAFPIEDESRPSKPVPMPTESTASVASDEKESQPNLDTELEQECDHCSLVMDHPCQIKEEDGVYINRQVGEVLIFPTDKSQDENWIQEHVINKKNIRKPPDFIFYSKSDSVKLEQFLKREQEGAAIIIKKKCLEHSKPCEACSILSKRQESNRENKLIRSIWDNVQSETGPDGKKRIRHSYVHRHDVSETFPPTNPT